jgi:hypothetical protein
MPKLPEVVDLALDATGHRHCEFVGGPTLSPRARVMSLLYARRPPTNARNATHAGYRHPAEIIGYVV